MSLLRAESEGSRILAHFMQIKLFRNGPRLIRHRRIQSESAVALRSVPVEKPILSIKILKRK